MAFHGVHTLRPRFTGLWRHPDFLRLWVGQGISIFGTLIGGIALQLTAILFLHAGPAEVAILSVCQFVPPFAVGPFAGVWVDRLPRRPIMIAADLGRFAALGSVPLAAVFGVLVVEQLYVVVVVTSTLGILFNVAYEAYLPTLVSRDRVVEGNSKLSATASVAEVGGFGISGWLVQALTGPGAVLVDTVSFLVSAFAVWRIRTPEPPSPSVHEREHILREAIEGVRIVGGNGVLRTFAITNVLHGFHNGIFSVALLIYLVEDARWSPSLLGLIFAVGGITSLAGAWAATRPVLNRNLGRSILASAAFRALGGFTAPLAGAPSPLSTTLLVGGQVVTDPAWTFFEIQEVSLRQAITPDTHLGRVNATMRFVGFGGTLLGTGVAATVGELFGAREALFIAAAVGLLVVPVIVFSPVARLRRAPVMAVGG